MKNLKKLSRNDLKDLKGGGVAATWCHMNYTGTLWGEDMVIVSTGSGQCPKTGRTKCYHYFQTSDDCSK